MLLGSNIMNLKFHVYIDEGGMFGRPRILVVDTKEKETKNENQITSYYQGKFTLLILSRYILGLNSTYKGLIYIQCSDGIYNTIEYYIPNQEIRKCLIRRRFS